MIASSAAAVAAKVRPVQRGGSKRGAAWTARNARNAIAPMNWRSPPAMPMAKLAATYRT